MSLQINPTARQELRIKCAKALLRIATMFQASEKAEWIMGPPRSKPGEHLRMDTGNARDMLVYTPTSPQEVAKRLEVRVGYRLNAWYAPSWELKSIKDRRIGLLEKLQQFQKTGLGNDIMGQYQS